MLDEGLKTGLRTFEVGLPALVQGVDLGERKFAEQTVVSTINSEEAILQLRSKVGPGVKVRLSLHVPRTFLLEKALDLNLTGTVCASPARVKEMRSKTAVRVRLDRMFRILPASI
ncbi:MAG: hypothetical protein NTW38_05305 [Candidatus Aminicenantes bacterium]|nr:hypothetical protein [Candidatus Aminicenantes bacterium]